MKGRHSAFLRQRGWRVGRSLLTLLKANVFGRLWRGLRLLGSLAYTRGTLPQTADGLYGGNSAVGVSQLADQYRHQVVTRIHFRGDAPQPNDHHQLAACGPSEYSADPKLDPL